MLRRVLKELSAFETIQYEIIENDKNGHEKKTYSLMFDDFDIILPTSYPFQQSQLNSVHFIKQTLDHI